MLGCERVGLPPEECVFVDDLRENCEGAEAVGMTAILHRGADGTLPELESCWASSCARASPSRGLGPGSHADELDRRDQERIGPSCQGCPSPRWRSYWRITPTGLKPILA